MRFLVMVLDYKLKLWDKIEVIGQEVWFEIK